MKIHHVTILYRDKLAYVGFLDEERFPGVYETPKAARLAAEWLDPSDAEELHEKVNNEIIPEQMLLDFLEEKSKEVTVYRVETENGEVFGVAIAEVWFPGSYVTEKAARLAAEKLNDEQAEMLQESIRPNSITEEMVLELIASLNK